MVFVLIMSVQVCNEMMNEVHAYILYLCRQLMWLPEELMFLKLIWLFKVKFILFDIVTHTHTNNTHTHNTHTVGPPPSGIDYYVHRSGRTGRKGQSGQSVLVLVHNDFSSRFLIDPREFLSQVNY